MGDISAHAEDHVHAASVRVEAATPEDWQVVRHLRLGALADEPDAFGSTLEQEVERPEHAWRERLTATTATTLVASLVGEDGEARPVGITMVAPAFGTPEHAGIYGVWVAPSARGRGVGDALLEAALDQARAAGYPRVVLDVGDHNTAAQALYARHGFEPTGRTGSLPEPRTHVAEHELARDLC